MRSSVHPDVPHCIPYPRPAGHPRFQGWRWSHGATAFAMFNTVQPPNDTFGGCRFDDRCGWLARQRLRLRCRECPPGRGQLCHRRRQRQVHQEHHEPTDLVGPRTAPVARSSAPTPTDPKRFQPRRARNVRARPRAHGRDVCRSSAPRPLRRPYESRRLDPACGGPPVWWVAAGLSRPPQWTSHQPSGRRPRLARHDVRGTVDRAARRPSTPDGGHRAEPRHSNG